MLKFDIVSIFFNIKRYFWLSLAWSFASLANLHRQYYYLGPLFEEKLPNLALFPSILSHFPCDDNDSNTTNYLWVNYNASVVCERLRFWQKEQRNSDGDKRTRANGTHGDCQQSACIVFACMNGGRANTSRTTAAAASIYVSSALTFTITCSRHMRIRRPKYYIFQYV